MSTLAATAAPADVPRRRLADRLNPILVKEVRQSLRGRYFRFLFWSTLGISTLSGLMVVASASAQELEGIGQAFFLVMFGCMSAAVHCFTPFSAFLSTSAEWDENTHDLLVLSNLRPRQIVFGKLLSALVQAMLYYSAFGPFLVFAFLLNGIDLLSISVLLACSFAACVGLSLIGIALASLARVRLARGLLMAVFGGGLALTWGASIPVAEEIARSPQDLRSPEGQMGVALFLSFALAVGGLFAVIACARFAHEEENRSSGMRLLSLALVLLAGIWGAWFNAQFGEEEAAWGTQIVAGFVLALLWLFFLTEKEELGRRTAKHVTPRPWLALLSIPFLPGGGRGVILYLVHFVCALTGALFALTFGAPTPDDYAESATLVTMFYAYGLVFLALPAGVASFFVRADRARRLTRIVIFLLPWMLTFGPAVVGLLLGIHSWMELEHPLNPAWVMDMVEGSARKDGVGIALSLLTLGATLAFVLNARRMRAGAYEVLDASRAARQRSVTSHAAARL